MGQIQKSGYEIEIDEITDLAIAHREQCAEGEGTCGKQYVCEYMAELNAQMLKAFYDAK
jgi:hypothetical protein